MGGGAVTNFPDRVCDNKVSCKKPAHLDQNGREMAVLSFPAFFGVGGDPTHFFTIESREMSNVMNSMY